MWDFGNLGPRVERRSSHIRLRLRISAHVRFGLAEVCSPVFRPCDSSWWASLNKGQQGLYVGVSEDGGTLSRGPFKGILFYLGYIRAYPYFLEMPIWLARTPETPLTPDMFLHFHRPTLLGASLDFRSVSEPPGCFISFPMLGLLVIPSALEVSQSLVQRLHKAPGLRKSSEPTYLIMQGPACVHRCCCVLAWPSSCND